MRHDDPAHVRPADFAADPPVDLDRWQYAMARYLIEGDERDEARLLLACRLEAKAEMRSFVYDTYTEASCEEYCLVLCFFGPRKVYDTLNDRSFGGGSTRAAFERAARALLPTEFETVVVEGVLALTDGQPPDWRNELLALLDDKDVDNQAVGFKATAPTRACASARSPRSGSRRRSTGPG